MTYDPKLPIGYIDGIPVPTGRKAITAQDVMAQLKDALMTEYTGDDPNKRGMTKAQAMTLSVAERAQDGDLAAIDNILNRLYGKPVQAIQNLNVQATLSEFLDELNRKPQPQTVVDITPEVDPLGD